MSAGEPRLMADQLLRDARMNKPPVRLSKLLRAQGVALEKAKLDPHVSSVLLEGPSPRIVVNSRLGRDQRRLSVAHSLAHHLLHPGAASAYVTDLTVHMRIGAPPQSDPRELEANAFALDLLIPEAFLRRDFHILRYVRDQLPEAHLVILGQKTS